MERIVYRITLDSHKTGIQRTLQGFETADNMARTIAVNITASGDTYEIPLDNVVAMMYVTTPGASEPSVNECRIEDNTIIYDVLPIVEEGITEMQLKLIETSVDGAKKVLIAPRFAVEVTESGTEDDGAEQTTTFTALEAAIAKAQGVYDARLLRIDIGEDCVFRAIYADGTVYENHYFHEALYNGNALLSESWAKGGTGIREGEETNNSKYFSDVSRSSSIEASASADEVRKLVDFAKLHSTYTSFDTNFETGELEYISASHTFDIDETTGELSVEGDLFDPSEVLESVADDYMDEKTQEIAQLKSDLSEETTQRKAEIAVERERINQFTRLEEGSTTGDAELADARVDIYGKTHANVGEHIRTVTGQNLKGIVALQENKADVFFAKDYGNLYNFATDTKINWSVHPDTGELYANSGYRATDYIEVLGGKTLFTNMNNYGAFYDKDKKYICGKPFNVLQMPIPINARYYRGSVEGEKRLKSYVAYYDMTNNFKKFGEGSSIEITDALFIECLNKYYKVKKSYTDKKIAIIGDSWSESGNGTCTKNWHDWIAEITGATIQCVAKSGTGYKKGTDNENLYNTFPKQALLIDSDTDLVILFGSGNDCGTGDTSNFTFGTARDTTSDTVCGCMNITLDNIQTTAPNARILMLSPAPWVNFDPWWTGEANNRMGVYTDLMYEVAKARGVRFKDMYHSSDMHPQNEVFKSTYYNADGIHPNDNGQKRLYPDILAEVKAVLPITES